MPSFLGLQKFFGSAVSSAAGFAAGAATAPVLHPEIHELENLAWQTYKSRRIDPGTSAAIVAEDVDSEAWGANEASYSGIDEGRFKLLLGEALNAPGIGELFAARRRGRITDADFLHGLRKAKLETRWNEPLLALVVAVLDPADLARGIHRGLVPDPGLLQGTLPGGTGNVPAYPVYNVDALAEAAAAGYDRDHLGVLVGLQGNPMGAHEAAEAYFRDILTNDDYLRAIAEGNTRNEWADAIREQTRQIPTARDFLENALRGYRTLKEAIAGAARHGMSEADAVMIYQNQGRPMAVSLITQALARGGKFKPEAGEITDPFMASIVEGSLKPAYYDLALAMRYKYPSPFVLRTLAQSGVVARDELEQILLNIGWEPKFAASVASQWAASTTATADPLVKKAETQLWNATHKAYVNAEATDAQARAELAALGADAATETAVLTLWKRERDVIRLTLTPSQIKKAFGDTIFTRAEAVARLERQGMSAADAATLLDE